MNYIFDSWISTSRDAFAIELQFVFLFRGRIIDREFDSGRIFGIFLCSWLFTSGFLQNNIRNDLKCIKREAKVYKVYIESAAFISYIMNIDKNRILEDVLVIKVEFKGI